jgi:hypothetical protein
VTAWDQPGADPEGDIHRYVETSWDDWPGTWEAAAQKMPPDILIDVVVALPPSPTYLNHPPIIWLEQFFAHRSCWRSRSTP